MIACKKENRRHPAAIVVTGLYLAAVVAAFIIMLLTMRDTAMSGIFLVMVTFPWSLPLTKLLDLLHLNPSPLVNGLFLLAGGAVNGYVLYRLISRLTRKCS